MDTSTRARRTRHLLATPCLGLTLTLACTGSISDNAAATGSDGTIPTSGAGSSSTAGSGGGSAAGTTSGTVGNPSGTTGSAGTSSLVPLQDSTVVPVDPRRKTLHRLNNAEYNNTVRDLLGTSQRPADAFVANDQGAGFDNIADLPGAQGHRRCAGGRGAGRPAESSVAQSHHPRAIGVIASQRSSGSAELLQHPQAIGLLLDGAPAPAEARPPPVAMSPATRVLLTPPWCEDQRCAARQRPAA